MVMVELFDVVDENDKIIGSFPRKEVMDNNMLHHGAMVFVINSKQQIYVHKRVKTKRVYGGMWDMFFGGAVESGETYLEAAKRELEEELGIKDASLEFIKKTRYQDKIINVFTEIYICIHDGPIKIQETEIEEVRIMTIGELEEFMKKEKFCGDALKNKDILKKIISKNSSKNR
jgi:mutator protein MutT